MRRSAPALAAALSGLAVAVSAGPALAHPAIPLDPAPPLDVTFSATDNIEHLGRFPEHVGTAGGAPSDDGRLFYLTDPRGVHVYDTSDPTDPRLLDFLPLPQTTSSGVTAGPALAQEDPDTDGRILLVDGTTSPTSAQSHLHVVDVSDPSDLQVLGTLPVADHTWTCVSAVDEAGEVNGCAYAYGRTGHIVDLTDPTRPQRLPVTWRAAVDYTHYTHDLTEVRPGLVMTAGATALLMDTTDPTSPVYLTEIGDRDRFRSLGYHSVEWARHGRDRYVVLGTEIAPGAVPGAPGNTAGSDCDGENSVIETWDATDVLGALDAYEVEQDRSVFDGVRWRKVDTFDAAGRGLFLDGKAPGSQLYCAHWMELHPDFHDGGLMAVAYYDRGTRFVEVDGDGTMTEVGWFTPAEGYTGSPQWVGSSKAGDVVYVMDYRRGLEVLRLSRRTPTGVVTSETDAVAPASAVQLPPLRAHVREVVVGGSVLLLALLVAVERLVRRRASALPA